jgi:hypothetical protein
MPQRIPAPDGFALQHGNPYRGTYGRFDLYIGVSGLDKRKPAGKDKN